jgi:hypothetical protein
MHITRTHINITSEYKITPKNLPSNKFCKNCKHFKAGLTGVQFGKCKLYGVQNLIDGQIDYKYASITREYDCKGDFYETKPTPFDKLKIPFEVLSAGENERTYDK